MKSRWYGLKDKVVKLRKQGFSMNMIENRYGIARSTLSGWFRKVKLTSAQKRKLLKNSRVGLIAARRKAVLWHNAQKEKRLKEAETQAIKTIKSIDIADKKILELALAILYMGEGTKRKVETAMGSSNPLALKFFLATLKALYNLDLKKIKCQLNLRADQNPKKMKRFWSKELKLPLNNFRHVNLDKRTIGSKTYPYYKGVCYVYCGNVAIQRKLICLSEIFCRKVVKKYLGTWRSG
ncbi:MAG: hypothetical protein COZ92_00120 [Candidatus Nealsonbacteria bacterium CG_4_8_14_3_um_filter_40_11]|uniref:HTH psq-type domain-containing protein n=3 Tax=Candidatus Nealsoniibacteriota TaxID=1817911 RepID=A0A2M7UVX8_9BACT|nr:MAG: hypothetical protein COZ92_00120 [Candidatus Nealsonbacteria bacterium CG_4_8_14_3_um_filter_40_11]PIZ88143.1 MAG: hypothetical protein COX91_01800 [Candidatus Nealsonbacteria bacterium CG_4_10_14_0_2_um_filter_39_15]